MLDRGAILRFADQFAGLAPDVVVERVKQHQAAEYAARQNWETTRNWRDQDAAQREAAMARAAQMRLAINFSAPRGWTLSKTDFNLRTLAEGKQHDGGQRYRKECTNTRTCVRARDRSSS